jgi:iron complex transport system substrate-binding protein
VRVISLLPSATEIVGELGLACLLVGRTEECDWPPEVAALPVVSASRVDTSTLSSREVDEAVLAAAASGRSLYEVDEDELRTLAPDLVLTQDLCAVCAVPAGDLKALDVPTLSLDPHTLADVADTIEAVGRTLGVDGRPRAERMRAELAAVRAATEGLDRPRVFLAEWVDPPYVPGHWLPELVEIAGGDPVLGRPGAHSVRTTWHAVREAQPDVLVLAPCGYDAERAALEPFPADVAGRVVAVDASAYYARPGPRLADGARGLAHLLHPEAVDDPGLPFVELTPAARR